LLASNALLRISASSSDTATRASSRAARSPCNSPLYFCALSSALPIRVDRSSRRPSTFVLSERSSLSCRCSKNRSLLASAAPSLISSSIRCTACNAASSAASAVCRSRLYFWALSSALLMRCAMSSTRLSALFLSARTSLRSRISWKRSSLACRPIPLISSCSLATRASADSWAAWDFCTSLLYFCALSSALPMRVETSSSRSSTLTFSVLTSLSSLWIWNRSLLASHTAFFMSASVLAAAWMAASRASRSLWRSWLYFCARISELLIRVATSSRRVSAETARDIWSLSCLCRRNLSLLASREFCSTSERAAERACSASSRAPRSPWRSWLYFTALSSALPMRVDRSSSLRAVLSFSVFTSRSSLWSWKRSRLACRALVSISFWIWATASLAASRAERSDWSSELYFWARSSALPMRVETSSSLPASLLLSVLASLSCRWRTKRSLLASAACFSIAPCIDLIFDRAPSWAAWDFERSWLYFWALSSAFPMRVLMSSRRPSASVARDSISLRSLCRRKRSARASFSLRCMSFSSLLMVSFSCSSAPRADWTSWLYF